MSIRTSRMWVIAGAVGALAALAAAGGAIGRSTAGPSPACPAGEARIAVAAPGGAAESLALAPALADAPARSDLAALPAGLPLDLQALEPAPGFTRKSVEVRTAAGQAWAGAYFEDSVQRRGIRAAVWTQCGQVTLVRPPESPVVRSQVLDVNGREFLAFLPSAQVAGGLGPREAWAVIDGWVVTIEGTGFTSDEAFAAALQGLVRGGAGEGGR